MRGRKPKPHGLKVISGTVRKDRDSDAPPTFDAVKTFPDAPQHLNVDGAAAWNDLGPKLVAAGVLQVVDLYPLEQLCYAWQRFRKKAKADMDITASEDNALKALWSEFGMTPASRRRVPNKPPADGAETPASSFANNGRRPA